MVISKVKHLFGSYLRDDPERLLRYVANEGDTGRGKKQSPNTIFNTLTTVRRSWTCRVEVPTWIERRRTRSIWLPTCLSSITDTSSKGTEVAFIRVTSKCIQGYMRHGMEGLSYQHLRKMLATMTSGRSQKEKEGFAASSSHSVGVANVHYDGLSRTATAAAGAVTGRKLFDSALATRAACGRHAREVSTVGMSDGDELPQIRCQFEISMF